MLFDFQTILLSLVQCVLDASLDTFLI